MATSEPAAPHADRIARGVRLHAPETIYIAPAVPPDAIAPGVEIFPGCRILGATTAIGPGCTLGKEGPLTLEDCQLQRDVALGGGYLSGATFLAGAALGADAHIRPGTLLEEQAGGGHAVGFKQTILFPFVTTGSLINFCDVLMAGGTDRKHHSEVGSSYIHFNFTPNQDKATASLVGDVPRGVMLDQPPIFLGGQGGLVGPARIAYGSVMAAGTIWRGDALEPGQVHFGQRREGHRPAIPGVYGNVRRLVANNLLYIGNLHALQQWYERVRARTATASPFDAAAFRGACARLALVRDERLKRLDEFVARLPASAARVGRADEAAFQREFAAQWQALRARLQSLPADVGQPDRDAFLQALPTGCAPHLDLVRGLAPAARRAGAAWLQALVDTAPAGLPRQS